MAKSYRLAAGSAAACVIAIFTGTIWPLMVTIWFGVASYVLGKTMLTWLKIDNRKLSNISIFISRAAASGTDS